MNFFFGINLFHDVANGDGLVGSRLVLVQLEEYILFDEVEFVHFTSLGVLRVLDRDDIGIREWLVANKVEVVLSLLIELKDGVVGVHVATCLDTDDVSVVCEHFVADWVLVFALLILGPMHLYQLRAFQWFASHWVLLELADEWNNVEHLKDVALGSANRVLKGTER